MDTFIAFLNKCGFEVRIGKHSQRLKGHYAVIEKRLGEWNKDGWAGAGHGNTPKEALAEAFLLHRGIIEAPTPIEEFGEINEIF